MKLLQALIAAAAATAVTAALPSARFGSLKTKHEAMIAVIFNSESGDQAAAQNAAEVVEEVVSRVDGFKGYQCDTSEERNALDAEEANLHKDVHIFVRTKEDGIEEFKMPITVGNLARYAYLRGIAGDPADVQEFTSRDDLVAMTKTTETHRGLPVFVKFFEPWCAHCFKMRRAFEAAATFFRNRISFVEVDCGLSDSHEAFCDEEGIKDYPTLRLYTGAESEPVQYKGSRSVAAFELFFHENRASFPTGAPTTFNVGRTDDNIDSLFPARSEDPRAPTPDRAAQFEVSATGEGGMDDFTGSR